MRPYKTVIYSFFLGGSFALVAQAIASIWAALLPGTPLEFFTGGATLVSMGVIGCVLGGLAVYQHLEEWATFGALLPFSGFAMAVGMKMLGPWTREGTSLGASVWKGLWLVIWFNVVGAVSCILLGFVCASLGVEPAVAAKNTSALVFPGAFLMGGVLCAFFQLCFLAAKAITPKAAPVWILLFAWMCGALAAPLGLSGTLANVFGQGFSVMIPVGGYNMYNVGASFALGEVGEGLVHLGSFLLAVFFLFFTGLMTFVIYNAKFGRTPLHEVHLEKARRTLAELEGDQPVPACEDNVGVDFDESGLQRA